MSDNPISDSFEQSFLSVPLETQVSHCDHYELAELFKKWLPDNQPILEAGCGSGRWVAWFVRQGWQAAGLDWSTALCERARREIPNAKFIAGDMRAIPVPDGKFGAIVSLGAVEHDINGPHTALKEYARVLRSKGIAIITVPHLGLAQHVTRFAKAVLRPLAGRNPVSRRETLGKTNRQWASDLMPSKDDWTFFQYLFTKPQMRAFLHENGFEIVEEFVDFKREGILHCFGSLAGGYDHANGRVVFNPLGRFLVAVVPQSWVGMMLCYVVRKT